MIQTVYMGQNIGTSTVQYSTIQYSTYVVVPTQNVLLYVQGASLELVYLERNERLAAWTFCSNQMESEPEITTFLPFTTDKNDTR
jgi:hypothetical protein